jgi:valyl-tRNA synthetase
MLDSKIKDNRWTKDFEKEIYESWKKNKEYSFDKKSKNKVYSIDTPPPYVNTPAHIGQATTYVIMDMFARYKRMMGYNVLFPLGLDRNGLPIELAAERKFNVKANKMARKDFIELCHKILQESSLETTDSFLRLGISFNSWEVGKELGNIYFTDSEDYRKLTQETFIDLWNKELIYEDERINNYCPGCQTTIADSEIERKDVETYLNFVKFTIKGGYQDVVIATTRPELLCTAALIIYNPSDERYLHLKDKKAVVPIFNIEVPIIPHNAADPNFGTGLVFMSRSAGDQDAVRFLRDMQIEPKMAIGLDGKMNENAGFLQGLTAEEARKKMIETLKERALMQKQEKIMHSVPICERSKHQIDFISMKEFYLKQLDYKEEMIKIARKLSFYSDDSRQILIDWINSITIDWPISRRRYYATEIPLWRCKQCNEIIVPPKGKYYVPWKENPPIDKCQCGSKEFVGENRVFDTWFDSSISPLYILKYSRDEEFFKKNFPCSLRPQGKEIIRTWLYYTLLKDYLLTNKIAFKDVWINYHIVDEKGRKMSKSEGNVIDPREVLDKFGAEPFRLWAVVEGNLEKTDFRCSFERIEGAGKTLTKLWNVARFISMFDRPKKVPKLTELDEFILQELNDLIEEARSRYEKYDFHNPVIKIKNFLWEIFASHYIELVKNRTYNQEGKFSKEEQNAAIYTLYYCLDKILELLAPVNPMLTSKLYFLINEEDIHKKTFPKVSKKYKTKFTKEELVEINSEIWKIKRENNKSLKDELSYIIIPDKFSGIQKDLREAHKAKEIKFGKFKVSI